MKIAIVGTGYVGLVTGTCLAEIDAGNIICVDIDDIKINNFYLRNAGEKEHFIVFSCNDKFYSYNYSRGHFVELKYNYLIENIKNKSSPKVN